ncbi:MAG: transporter related protein, partial [Flaviaesturariibacter sp.]|nr:transporter related protein [Flaviaesturariibacter sp.]
EEWVAWKERKARDEKSREQGAKNADNRKETASRPPESPKPQPQAAAKPANAPINKEAQKELQKTQRLFQQAEQQLAELNKKRETLEAALAAPDTYSNPGLFKKTEEDYAALQGQLKTANAQYEELFEKVLLLEGNG